MSAMMKRLLLTMATDCLSEPAFSGLGNLEREFFLSIIMTRRWRHFAPDSGNG